MAVNECGHEVPAEVEARARELNCLRLPKFLYREGEYGESFPMACIGGQTVRRFKSNRFETFKKDLGHGWVAFLSPSNAPSETISLPEGDIPPLPVSRAGEVSRTQKIDGSPFVFKVEEQEIFAAPSNPMKAYLLQKIKVDDGNNFEQHHMEFRIAYYMIAHKGKKKGKWTFGQFAPIMTLGDLAAIMDKIRDLGWLQAEPPQIST